MSTSFAFTPARAPRAASPVGEVISIEAARAARRTDAPGSGQRRPPSPDRVPLRLTRRGQIVVAAALVLLLTLVVTAAVLLTGHQAIAGEQASAVPARYHVVLPGETLWSIAGRVAPDADRLDTISRIQRFNALDTVALSTGQRIAIPGDIGAG